VLISGANRGIGLAIAKTLGEAGWRLSLGVRRPDAMTAAVADAFIHAYEAQESASAERWVKATWDRFGRIDAVIANAGVLSTKTVIEADDDEVDRLFAVNVKAPLVLARAAWPHLARSGRGRFVVLSSLSGKRVKSARGGLYAVSKFAALGLSHGIRHAGWDQGIRATALCPGPVDTDMIRAFASLSEAEMTNPADLAKLVALVLDLPNTASVSEIPVNALLESAH
jgi:NAD(P)-dependent dehydrogenase (short-subunit alcohol dehydrogenase family)